MYIMQTFTGHTGPIYAVAINPVDPRGMLTGGGDDRAFLWHASALPLPAPPAGTSLHACTWMCRIASYVDICVLACMHGHGMCVMWPAPCLISYPAMPHFQGRPPCGSWTTTGTRSMLLVSASTGPWPPR